MTLLQIRWVVMGLLGPVHALLLAWLACCASPTSDEVAHLAAGIRIWQQGKIDLYLVNPPLVKAVATIPIMLAPPQTDWRHVDTTPGARPEWLVGVDYVKANPSRFRWDFLMARWMCLPFSLLGLFYCYWWSEDLFGPAGGMLSASLWCFSPMILGNGALITPDVPAAALGLATSFHFRRWFHSGLWRDALVTGVFLGLTELTKMTWLLLYGILPVLWVGLEWCRQDSTGRLRRGVQLLCLLLISLDILHVGYLFDHSLQPLQDYEFTSELLSGQSPDQGSGNRFREAWWGSVPIPVPAAYLYGLDLQRRDFESGTLVSYLRGELRNHGWWYYYLYGVLIKEPLGIWLIILSCLLPGRKRKSPTPSEWLLLLSPMICLFLFVSSQTGFSRYVRYVLPALPFLWVALGRSWSPDASRCRKVIAGVGLLLYLGASLIVCPHSLSFFNSLAGGPQQGHWHLLDSNVDWGQDLCSLQDWIRQHPEAEPMTVSCSGVLSPELLGITSRPITLASDSQGNPKPGWYAISVNHLHGYDDAPPLCKWFLGRPPVARAGNSVLIYHIPDMEQPL